MINTEDTIFDKHLPQKVLGGLDWMRYAGFAMNFHLARWTIILTSYNDWVVPEMFKINLKLLVHC